MQCTVVVSYLWYLFHICDTCFKPVTLVSYLWYTYFIPVTLGSYLWYLFHTWDTWFILWYLFHTCGTCFIHVVIVSSLWDLFHTWGTCFIHMVLISYLQYFGHQSISVLDGGFSQWLEENGDVSKERCSNCNCKVCNLCLFLNSVIK